MATRNQAASVRPSAFVLIIMMMIIRHCNKVFGARPLRHVGYLPWTEIPLAERQLSVRSATTRSPVADLGAAGQDRGMKTLGIAIAALLLASSTAIAAPRTDGCDLPKVKYLGDLQSLLSHRAVEVVNSAAKREGDADGRLQQMVAPSADFSLGAGDVGRPLGKGVAGARALAAEMKADTFRYLDWNFIPTPVDDICASQKVEVEFSDTHRKSVYPVIFTFEAGQVVAAEAWTRTFQAGPLEPIGK